MTRWTTTTARPRVTLAAKLAGYVCDTCGSHLVKQGRRAVCPDNCGGGIVPEADYAVIVKLRAHRNDPEIAFKPERRPELLAALFATD